jgi:hypothetical protein
MLVVVKSFMNKNNENPADMISRKQGNQRGESASSLDTHRERGRMARQQREDTFI